MKLKKVRGKLGTVSIRVAIRLTIRGIIRATLRVATKDLGKSGACEGLALYAVFWHSARARLFFTLLFHPSVHTLFVVSSFAQGLLHNNSVFSKNWYLSLPLAACILQNPRGLGIIVNPRKLEHGFRRISTRIPYTLP